MATAARAEETPLALHRGNPQYFLFRYQPTILIASGEQLHLGRVTDQGRPPREQEMPRRKNGMSDVIPTAN